MLESWGQASLFGRGADAFGIDTVVAVAAHADEGGAAVSVIAEAVKGCPACANGAFDVAQLQAEQPPDGKLKLPVREWAGPGVGHTVEKGSAPIGLQGCKPCLQREGLLLLQGRRYGVKLHTISQ